MTASRDIGPHLGPRVDEEHGYPAGPEMPGLAAHGSLGAVAAPVHDMPGLAAPAPAPGGGFARFRPVSVVAAAAGALLLINSLATAAGPTPFRWWANFIVLPGLVFLAVSAGLPRAARETRFVLAWIGAIVLTVGVLLFAHSMGRLWPLMIVVPCLGPAALFALRPADASVRAFVDTVAGLGAVAIVLGFAFLAIQGGMVDPGEHRWWAWFMLAAAAVPAVNGFVLLAGRRGTYWFSMAVLLVAIGTYTALAGIAELNR